MTEIPLKETCEPDVRKVCVFLSDYSAWLLGCGSTCVRLEKNVTRIARAYGKTVDITIMPRHVHISVRDKNGGDFVTSVATIRHTPISFNINTRLSELSWAIAAETHQSQRGGRAVQGNCHQRPSEPLDRAFACVSCQRLFLPAFWWRHHCDGGRVYGDYGGILA